MGWNRLQTHRRQRRAVRKPHPAVAARATAVAATRRAVHPVIHAEKLKRRAVHRSDLDALAHAAPPSATPAGAFEQLLLPDHNRISGFDHLARYSLDPARKRSRGESVGAGPRAASAAVEE